MAKIPPQERYIQLPAMLFNSVAFRTLPPMALKLTNRNVPVNRQGRGNDDQSQGEASVSEAYITRCGYSAKSAYNQGDPVDEQ